YATSAVEDEMTARLRPGADRWVEATAMPDGALAERIGSDGIDVLIETTGITQGHRLGGMAMRPAPGQASFIGYPTTAGLRAIDYRIADAHTEPEGSERFSTEKIVRLAPTYWCYRPDPAAPEPRERDAGEGVVFGSFNSAPKLNARVIGLWARLLGVVPG